MKRIVGLLFVALVGLTFCSDNVYAQVKKKKAPAKKVNTGKKKPKPTVSKPVTDTTALTKVNSDTAVIPVPLVLPSMRNNSAVERNLIKDKVPLEYEYLREDDQYYKEVLWRNIEVKEKMNLPFTYSAEEDNGSQEFINILLKAIRDDGLIPFSGVNDRFTTMLKTSDIADMMVGKSYTIQKPDFDKDPDGSKGLMKDTTIREEFNTRDIETYQIKEEVIFDKKTSRLHWRILGIAPMLTKRTESGEVKGQLPLFWIYYPDARPIFAKYEAYNPRNYANRMSWEEVFESHYFTSYIVKSTLNNPGNKPLAAIVSDPLLRLMEGENIKNTIFDFEQAQWSY